MTFTGTTLLFTFVYYFPYSFAVTVHDLKQTHLRKKNGMRKVERLWWTQASQAFLLRLCMTMMEQNQMNSASDKV